VQVILKSFTRSPVISFEEFGCAKIICAIGRLVWVNSCFGGENNLSKEKVPMKIVVPLIVVTWVLSLISSLAIVSMVPSLLGIKTEIGSGLITTAKIADSNVTASKISDGAIITAKLADGSVTSAKILDGSVLAQDLANGSIISAKIANGAVTTENLADFSVTALELAAYAIPHNETSVSTSSDSGTSSTAFTDMPAMSVQITLARNSTLLIMFGARSHVEAAGNYLYVRAMVNSTLALPSTDYIIFTMDTNYAYHSITFYLNAPAGTYTVKIQWRVYLTSSSGTVAQRSLIVMALPA
jgi:hypothetical protein